MNILYAFQPLYNRFIRPRLPKTKYRICAGIAVQDKALLDLGPRHYPEYKAGLLEGIRETVDDGDTVVIVGGGRGVSTIHCARAGADEVIALEAAASMIETAEQTLSENYVPEGCSVEFKHALVGEAVEVYGAYDDAEFVAPNELPECDVLVMDCEGAERSILAGVEGVDAAVVIEGHPERGVDPDLVRDELRRIGIQWDEREYEPGSQKPVFVGT